MFTITPCVCTSMSSSVAHLVVRISLDENLIRLEMLILPFTVPDLSWSWFFVLSSGSVTKFQALTPCFPLHIFPGYCFFDGEIKANTYKIKDSRLYVFKSYTYSEKLTWSQR